jgi:hypothetical protein
VRCLSTLNPRDRFGEFGPIYAGFAVTIHAAAFRKGVRARSPSAPAVRRLLNTIALPVCAGHLADNTRTISLAARNRSRLIAIASRSGALASHSALEMAFENSIARLWLWIAGLPLRGAPE